MKLGTVPLTDGLRPAVRANWVQLGDELLVWCDKRQWREVMAEVQPSGLELHEYEGSIRSRDLHLVVQVGRAFQQEYPSVRVLVDKGRFLVVEIAASEVRTFAQHDEPCFDVRRLPVDAVIFRPITRSVQRVERTVETLVADISPASYEAFVTHLASLPTRHSLSTHFATAADWARDLLQGFGYTTRLDEISVESDTSWNLVADRNGSGPAIRDLLLVTAHLDCINLAGGPSASAPGADDNASGAAGLLEIGRILSKHHAVHDLRLILFGGEEQGLLGSRQYVNGLAAEDRGRLRAVINMDMIGALNTREPTVLLEGAAVSQALIDDLAAAAATYTSLQIQASLNPFASDHVPFIEASLPAVLTIEGADGANGNIHTAGDTLAHIDYDLAVEIVRMNLAAAASALSRGSTPTAHWLEPVLHVMRH